MHRVRLAVRENRLSDPARITEQSYLRYVEGGSAWVAAARDRTVVGFAVADQADSSVWALFVHPGWEGAGVGKALHDSLLAWARDRGLERLWLTTTPGTRAEQFYLKAGWSKAGVLPTGEVRFERMP